MGVAYTPPTQDVVLTATAASWYEENAERFPHNKLPKVKCLGLRSAHTGVTTYNLADLDNYLLKVGGRAWVPGQPWRAPRPVGETTVSIRLKSEKNDPTMWPVPRGAGLRLEDAKRPIAEHMFLLESRRLQAMVNAMISGGYTSKNWTGTTPFGTTDAGAGTLQDPLTDIGEEAVWLKTWRSGRLKLVAACDSLTLQALARKPAYHGAGIGSGLVSQLTNEQIVSTLKSTHGFEEVWIVDLPADPVALGQTSAPAYLAATPFFWMGLVEREDYDLTTSTQYGPDGALVLAEEFSPWVDEQTPEGLEVTLVAGKDSFDYPVPRASLGKVITGNFT